MKSMEEMMAAAQEAAQTVQRQMNEDTEGSSLAALKKAGMQAVETPDRDSFAKIVTAEVEKEFVGKYGSETLDAIKKAAV